LDIDRLGAINLMWYRALIFLRTTRMVCNACIGPVAFKLLTALHSGFTLPDFAAHAHQHRRILTTLAHKQSTR